MNKNILIYILLLVTNAFYAQATFSEFENKDGINAVVISKKMFDLMSKVKVTTSDHDTQKYMELIKRIDYLQVFTTQSISNKLQMKSAVEKYSKEKNLEEIMRLNENDKNIRLLIKSIDSTTRLKEMVLFIEENKNKETILMSILGNFDLNEIPILTEKMEIPVGMELKKATSKK